MRKSDTRGEKITRRVQSWQEKKKYIYNVAIRYNKDRQITLNCGAYD